MKNEALEHEMGIWGWMDEALFFTVGSIAIGKTRMLGSFEGGKPWSWAEIPH